MAIDSSQLAVLRQHTPACEDLIHFNNAGASPMPEPVLRSVIEHLHLENRIGGYEAERAAEQKIQRFYSAFADLFRVNQNEIAYMENATRAWDAAFYALPLQAGDRIITHASEYASNYLAFLQLAKRKGIHIDVAPCDTTGQIDVEQIEPLITNDTKLIAITYVPSQGGLVNPVQAVGQVAQQHGLWYLLDACQSVGQLDIDIPAIGCHLLTGTGRKFLRGPRGTGFLYVSQNILEHLDPPFIDLHSAEWTDAHQFKWADGALRFENFEGNVAGKIGLATAVDYAMDIGLVNIEHRITHLATYLRRRLNEITQITVQDQGTQRCGIVTFTAALVTASDIAHQLRRSNINVSVTPQNYAQLDLGERKLKEIVRASVHYFNTEEEVDQFIVCLRKICE